MCLTEFVSSTRALFMLSRVLGLAPWSFVTSGKQPRGIHFRVRGRYITYTLLVILSMLTWLVYIVSWRVLNEYVNASITFIVPQLAALLVSSITTLVSQIVSITYGAHKMVNIVYLIADVDRRLLENSKAHYSTAQRILTTQVLILLLIVGILYGYDMWIWLYKKGDNYVIFRGISYLINAVMILQYMSFSQLLIHRFGIVNKKLGELSASNDVSYRHTVNDSDFRRSNQGPHLIHRSEYSPPFTTHRVVPTVIKSPDSEYGNLVGNAKHSSLVLLDALAIRSCRELHSDLTSIASMLNAYYGVQCLLVFATVFIMLVKGLYFLLTTLSNPTVTKVDTTFNVHAAVIVLLWALFHALELMGITACCHLASARANTTARVVHKLLLVRFLTPSASKELVVFSQQLLQTKLNFTACGFFFVDLHVLCVTAGAVMTYTIILNQAYH